MDYNYNIETVLSSDTFLKVNEQIMVLELFLALNPQTSPTGDKAIRRVVVEMNLDEARAFVNKLKDIEKELIAAS